MMSPVALLERFNAILVPDILFGKADSSHAGWAGESLLSSPRFLCYRRGGGDGKCHVRMVDVREETWSVADYSSQIRSQQA